ncbi:MAG: hydrogenase nickel incorporation protein HypB [Candidatus Ratteibacteria bacterium]
MKKIQVIEVGASIFEENDKIAGENRSLLREMNTVAINVMGSPGAGKTSVLEKTIAQLKSSLSFAVIEGDIKGALDAERLVRLEIPVIQINTGGACHLDALMVKKGLAALPLKEADVVFVENVGNLVCPAEFDIGALLNVVIASVPEGEDKPLKYPMMFKTADICILNKMDFLPYANFDIKRFKRYLGEVSCCKLFPLSVKSGEGFSAWIEEFSDLLCKQRAGLKDIASLELKGRVAIMGIGDRMKADDAVGSLVAELLSKTVKRKNIKIIDAGNAVENYVGVIKRFKPDTVVVIDAVDFQGKAGDIKIMGCGEIEETTISTHGFSLALILENLQKETGAECRIIGVQPVKVSLSEEISPAVERAIQKLVKEITLGLCR